MQLRPEIDGVPPCLLAALENTAASYPDHPALWVPPPAGVHERSYRQLLRCVEQRLACYRAVGYSAGHRVALMLENRPEFFIEFYALNGLGASVVPLHQELADEELRWRLAHCEAVLAVTLPAHSARVAALSDVAVITPSDSPPRPTRAGGDEPPGPASEAALLYTSGTTARPKGCLLSNAYFLALGRWYLNQGGLCTVEPGRERLITPLPVSHMNAMACSSMAMLLSGGCLVQLDRFHPSSWWTAVRESQATIVHYLGVMCGLLLAQPAMAEDSFAGQVKFGFGANVDPRDHSRFERRFGFPLIEAWAMTETGAGACIAASHEPRHIGRRCFGRAPASVAYRIVNEQERDLPAGEPGELLVRSAGPDSRRGFFSGYFADEAATAEAWRGGWFHTGDIVRVGPDGSLYFIDRRKNLIRRSGENIAAAEVEAALAASPRVELCAVAPVADGLRGEEIMACVVVAAGTTPGRAAAERIFADCLALLARHKAPGYIAFVDRLPTTATQKVRRAELERLCREKLERGDCFDLREGKRGSRAAAP